MFEIELIELSFSSSVVWVSWLFTIDWISDNLVSDWPWINCLISSLSLVRVSILVNLCSKYAASGSSAVFEFCWTAWKVLTSSLIETDSCADLILANSACIWAKYSSGLKLGIVSYNSPDYVFAGDESYRKQFENELKSFGLLVNPSI